MKKKKTAPKKTPSVLSPEELRKLKKRMAKAKSPA